LVRRVRNRRGNQRAKKNTEVKEEAIATSIKPTNMQRTEKKGSKKKSLRCDVSRMQVNSKSKKKEI